MSQENNTNNDMSVLESIRKRAGIFIVLFVGFALLAFILNGAFESGFSFLGGNEKNIGEINGKTIKIADFDNEVKKQEAQIKAMNPNAQIDEQTRTTILQNVWTEYMDKFAYLPQFEKLGLSVGEAELNDMLMGENVDPQLKDAQAFKDSITGQFNPALVKRYIEQISEVEDDGDSLNAGKVAAKKQFALYEDGLIKNRQKSKYENLISKGFYVTKAEAKRKFAAQNTNASVRYVAKRYSEKADSTVKVTDDEIKAAFEKYKYLFNTTQSLRRIQMVSFSITPSAKDIGEVKSKLEGLKADFETAKNDTVFVNNYASTGNNIVSLMRNQLPMLSDSGASYAVGNVIGPYTEANIYKLSKIVGVKTAPDSVKARHILLSTQVYSADKAKTTSDSIVTAIKGGASFAELATKYSADQGSAVKGGELGFANPTQYVPEFRDACINGKVGDLQVVNTKFGTHIIEVQEQKNFAERYTVAIIDIPIEAGKETRDSVYNKATEFAATNTTLDMFEKAAKDKKLTIRPAQIREGDAEIQNMKGSKELLIWAVDKAEVGQVSEAKEFDNAFWVAALKSIRKKGIADFESVKDDAKFLAIRDKKGEEFKKTLTAAATGATTIDEVGTKANVAPASVSTMFNASTIGSIGSEPGFIGYLSTLQPNKLSQVYVGNNGVFVAVIDSVTQFQKMDDNTLKAAVAGLNTQLNNTARNEVKSVIEFMADVVDRRYRFY